MPGSENASDWPRLNVELSPDNLTLPLFIGIEHPPQEAAEMILCIGVVVTSDSVLMLKRRNPVGRRLWVFPGGKLEAKSDSCAIQAAKRELIEETGVSLPGVCVFTCDRIHPRTGLPTKYFLFMANDKQCAKNKENDKHEKVEWKPISFLWDRNLVKEMDQKLVLAVEQRKTLKRRSVFKSVRQRKSRKLDFFDLIDAEEAPKTGQISKLE